MPEISVPATYDAARAAIAEAECSGPHNGRTGGVYLGGNCEDGTFRALQLHHEAGIPFAEALARVFGGMVNNLCDICVTREWLGQEQPNKKLEQI